MNIESRIWTYAGTGTKVHAFLNGVALCRKNLRNDPARVERMGHDYSGAVHYASVCSNCEKKFSAAIERAENERRGEETMNAPAPKPLTQDDVDAMFAVPGDEVTPETPEENSMTDTKITPGVIEALATIRNQPGRTSEEALNLIVTAFDILDNAGIFAAIDEATGYDVDPEPERVSKCTCPAAMAYHLPGCPGDPAEWGDMAYTTVRR